jgi:hypothetical protein
MHLGRCVIVVDNQKIEVHMITNTINKVRVFRDKRGRLIRYEAGGLTISPFSTLQSVLDANSALQNGVVLQSQQGSATTNKVPALPVFDQFPSLVIRLSICRCSSCNARITAEDGRFLNTDRGEMYVYGCPKCKMTHRYPRD